MGAQLQNLYNQGAMQQGNDYNTKLGQYFNQTTPTSPYWGTYTEPMNINPPMPVSSTTTDKNGHVVKTNTKDKSTSSFDNPSPLPNYSMYIAPSQMPDINAYLANPNSLLGAMQDAGLNSSGAGRYANFSLLNNSTGKTNV